MLTTIYFWVLIGIALVSFGAYAVNVRHAKNGEECETSLTVWVVSCILLAVSMGAGFLFDLSSRYPSDSRINNAGMTASLLRDIQHSKPELVSVAGHLTTYTGSYYFLNDKNGIIHVYYLAQRDGVAFFRRDKTKSQTTKLANECVRNDYPPACHRLITKYTYHTILTFWMPTDTVLRVYHKPRPIS